MITTQSKSGFVNIDKAKLYYEISGAGTPIVMIHAGVADSRQWNNEFTYFSSTNQVLRYDMRGHGKSVPVEGEFRHITDLVSLLDALDIHTPLIIMGCSMGGSLAIDFALMYPSKVSALILVDAGPSGLELKMPELPKYADAVKAFEAGNLDLTAEIETQIWFDGIGRAPEQVNQKMRKLLFEMNRLNLSHEVKQLGSPLPNTETPAVDRLETLEQPVLIIAGAHDIPYILAAADHMEDKIELANKIIIEDAAHLPNMDRPLEFQGIVREFLMKLPSNASNLK
jgi:pimeloyl-ACP methyl ester carboxylesterase